MSVNPDFFWPMFAQVILTAAIWLRMYLVRVAEMRARRISPQQLALSSQAAELLKNTSAADNFRNLFEVPVLFFALCLFLIVSGSDSMLLAAMAWAFVALRALHSAIHVTSNRVMRRFQVYVVGTLLLYAMWIVAAIEMVGSRASQS